MGNAWVLPSTSHIMGRCHKTHCMGRIREIGTHTIRIVWVLFSHSILILWYTSSYGKCLGFPINFSQHGKMQQNSLHEEKLRNWYSYFSHSMGTFFIFNFHPMVYFIIWEMHGLSHQFPIVWEKTAKPIEWGKPQKLVPIQFPQYGYFFHQIPILWHTSSYGKCICVFSLISHIMEQAAKLLEWGKPGKLVPTLFLQYECFLPLDSHPVVYFIIWEMHGLPLQFLIAKENPTKPRYGGETRKLVLILFPQHGCFFHIRFLSYSILHHLGNAWVSPSISHSIGKCNKTRRIGSLGVWILFFYQIPILWYNLPHGKCMAFPINFRQHGKMQ